MDESAVSETVGVILMVAITVILAAIIAGYIFGLVHVVPPSKNIMVTIERPTVSTITITYRGGQDQKALNSLRIIWPQGLPEPVDFSPTVGKIYGPRPITPGAQNHVVVIGTFNDTQEQVLINTFLY
jgi:flagellin-like protein